MDVFLYKFRKVKLLPRGILGHAPQEYLILDSNSLRLLLVHSEYKEYTYVWVSVLSSPRPACKSTTSVG